MATEVRDNSEQHRYEVAVDGAVAGFAAYRRQPGTIAFLHTEVDDAFKGRGVGSILVREALEDARRRRVDVIPICPFVSSFIGEHREYLELVPASRREEFGL